MYDFNAEALPGFDAAKYNLQQYKAAWLQRLIESGDIKNQSDLLKASVAIDASSKVHAIVQDWAARSNAL